MIKTFNGSYYHIEELKNNNKLNILENKELSFNNKNRKFQLWKLIEQNSNYYKILNYNNCSLTIGESNIYCAHIPLNLSSNFKLVKIYSEVKEKNRQIYSELLNKEPIDVLIKYIDLRDSNLNRTGIHQIEKDYDNEELRYSIRSILNNIPWIRKIFILMPNEKVRFFKEYNFIKDKIVYVKDKDLLGYDSSNCNAFLFRYWKMKNFGISDNIIVMDDDCFIGNKLQKKDFFYVKYGKVIPLVTTNNFIKIDKNFVLENLKIYETKAKESQEEQNDEAFCYSKYLTYSFVLNLFNISFNQSIFIPKYTHNAIPVNLKDLKEIYELTYTSKYKYSTLDCSYRIIGYLHFQIFFSSYTFIKYKRKVNIIPSNYIKINNSIVSDYKFSLFCLNKGPGTYNYLDYYKAKILMEYLFPIPSPFEIEYNSIKNISFNLTYSINNELKECKIQIAKMVYKKSISYIEFNFMILIVLLLLKYNKYKIIYCGLEDDLKFETFY